MTVQASPSRMFAQWSILCSPPHSRAGHRTSTSNPLGMAANSAFESTASSKPTSTSNQPSAEPSYPTDGHGQAADISPRRPQEVALQCPQGTTIGQSVELRLSRHAHDPRHARRHPHARRTRPTRRPRRPPPPRESPGRFARLRRRRLWNAHPHRPGRFRQNHDYLRPSPPHRPHKPRPQHYCPRDPVERDLPGITQIEVSPFGQLTYEKALRSILRQDPQVLMLGEIRDAATASLAVQAALSGHRLITPSMRHARRRHHPPARDGHRALSAHQQHLRSSRPAAHPPKKRPMGRISRPPPPCGICSKWMPH